MPKLPKFTDAKAVTALVIDTLDQDELDLYLAEYKLPDVRIPLLTPEDEAVAAALDGDIKPLAALLMPVGGKVNPAIKSLSPETWSLIVKLLNGWDKPKRKRGRPPMTADAKLEATPSYLAKEEFRWIKKMLRAWYPEQPVEQVEVLAEKIAQGRAKTATNLRNMVKKGRHV